MDIANDMDMDIAKDMDMDLICIPDLIPKLVFVPHFLLYSGTANDSNSPCTSTIPFYTDYVLGDSILNFYTFKSSCVSRTTVIEEDKSVSSHNSSFIDLQLNLPIKEINNIVKKNCLTKEEEDLIKYERRKFFNRYYARVARFKRKQKKINNSTVVF